MNLFGLHYDVVIKKSIFPEYKPISISNTDGYI